MPRRAEWNDAAKEVEASLQNTKGSLIKQNLHRYKNIATIQPYLVSKENRDCFRHDFWNWFRQSRACVADYLITFFVSTRGLPVS